jgi:hypothetical protein
LIGSILGQYEWSALLDFYFLCIFASLFLLIHIGWLIWLNKAYAEIRHLKKKERYYLNKNREIC